MLGKFVGDDGTVHDENGKVMKVDTNCHWHIITLIALLLAAAYEIIRIKKLNAMRIASASILNIAIALIVMYLGSCRWDLILGLISMIAVPVIGLLLRNKSEDDR